MKVWEVGNSDLFFKREDAFAAAKKCLVDGMTRLKKESVEYRTLAILIEADLELALAYWNNHAHPTEDGVGSPIPVVEKQVRR